MADDHKGQNYGRRTYLKGSAVAVSAGSITSISGCLGDDGGVSLIYGAGGEGSGTFQAGQAMQSVFRDHTDIDLTNTTTGGTLGNQHAFNDFDVDMYGTAIGAALWALNGEEPFTGDQAIDNHGLYGWRYGGIPSADCIVSRADTDITSTEDLAGTNFWPYWPGSTRQLGMEYLLDGAGILDDLNIVELDQTDVPGALEEERIDAFGIYGDEENMAGWVTEVDARNEFQVVEPEGDYLDALMEMDFPPTLEEITGNQLAPADYALEHNLKDFEEEIPLMTMTYEIYLGSEEEGHESYVRDDDAYEMIDTLHAHPDEVDEIYPGDAYTFSDPGADPFFSGASMVGDYPVHPGIMDWYEDHASEHVDSDQPTSFDEV